MKDILLNTKFKRALLILLQVLAIALCFAIDDFQKDDDLEIIIGSGNLTSRIPIDLYWRNNLYQCIFHVQELDGMAGYINRIAFVSSYTGSAVPDIAIKIYLGYTTQSDLADGWYPADQMTLVYDGVFNFNPGVNRVWLDLDTPFLLPEDRNLVLLVNRLFGNSMISFSYPFLAQNCAPLNARRHSSDAYNLDPYNPPVPTQYQLIGMTPQTYFSYTPYSVSLDDSHLTAPSLPKAQVYPNPFNPETTISFKIPQSAFTELSVYDLRGRNIATLHNGILPQGEHSFVWNADNVKSGIYLLRLSYQGQSSISKMMLVK